MDPTILIPLESIESEDCPTDVEDTGLFKSILDRGLMMPLLVAPAGNKFKVLNGKRRLAVIRAIVDEGCGRAYDFLSGVPCIAQYEDVVASPPPAVPHLSLLHLSVFYDAECQEMDGLGWCVDTNEDHLGIVSRFATREEAVEEARAEFDRFTSEGSLV